MDSISSKPGVWTAVTVSAGALIPRLPTRCAFALTGWSVSRKDKADRGPAD